MKILISSIIITLLAFGSAASAALSSEGNGSIDSSVIFDGEPEQIFSDVSADDWFFDDVSYVYNNNIMSGVSEEEFAPGTGVTRAMMITVLYRAANEPESGDPYFSDVDPSAWYAKAVSWGAENNIVSGTGNNMFSPEEYITREQLAVMLYNYGSLSADSGAEADISAYSDYEAVSPWAQNALRWAVGNNIISGKSETELAPSDGASRAEAAAIIKRFLTL